MTNTRIRLTVTGLALFCALGGTAQAAKGVKKVAPVNGTPRIVAGVVTHVAHKNGSGSFQMRTANHHKKVTGTTNTAAGTSAAAGTTAAGTGATGTATAATTPQQRQFHVTGATRFGHSNGTPASFASLRAGERVRVQATGNNANAVQIMSQQRVRGNFARYRTRMYNPYVYRPYYHPHVIRHRR